MKNQMPATGEDKTEKQAQKIEEKKVCEHCRNTSCQCHDDEYLRSQYLFCPDWEMTMIVIVVVAIIMLAVYWP